MLSKRMKTDVFVLEVSWFRIRSWSCRRFSGSSRNRASRKLISLRWKNPIGHLRERERARERANERKKERERRRTLIFPLGFLSRRGMNWKTNNKIRKAISKPNGRYEREVLHLPPLSFYLVYLQWYFSNTIGGGPDIHLGISTTKIFELWLVDSCMHTLGHVYWPADCLWNERREDHSPWALRNN